MWTSPDTQPAEDKPTQQVPWTIETLHEAMRHVILQTHSSLFMRMSVQDESALASAVKECIHSVLLPCLKVISEHGELGTVIADLELLWLREEEAGQSE